MVGEPPERVRQGRRLQGKAVGRGLREPALDKVGELLRRAGELQAAGQAGEFLGELNASHTYHGGGDVETGASRSIGMLGVDWELANGAYRIKRIVRGGPWDTWVRSQLDEPGFNVKERDYVLAVNGRPIDSKADPWASFEVLGKKTVVLTVNGSPSPNGAPHFPNRT